MTTRETPEPMVRARADTPPPLLGSWGRIYLLVAGLLLFETAMFWWLSRWAA